MSDRPAESGSYDSDSDGISASNASKPDGKLPILQVPEGFIPDFDRGDIDLDEIDDGIPPEVKAIKNRAGCYMFFLGTLFLFGLVLLSDFGGKLTRWFATKREAPAGYQQLRDQPGINFPPSVLRHMAQGVPTPLNAQAALDESGYPGALLSFLVELIEAARMADAGQETEKLQAFVSTERFLEEIETSGEGPDIDSSNRQYWRNWAESSAFHFEFGAENEILGFEWLIEQRDGLATILTHGDEELRTEVIVAYVQRTSGKWAVYDLRYASEHMSDVHFRARAATCEPFQVENLNVLYERLQSVVADDSAPATKQVKLQYAFEVFHFPKSIRPEAERFYTWHLWEAGFFSELDQFLTPERRQQSLVMADLASAVALELGDAERANAFLSQAIQQVAWHPLFVQAENLVDSIGEDRALPLLRRGAMLMPEDREVIGNYCSLLSTVDSTDAKRSSRIEFEQLARQLEQCQDGAARARILAESITEVAAELAKDFDDAVRMHELLR